MATDNTTEGVQRELRTYLADDPFLRNLNLTKYSYDDIVAWIRSKLDVRYSPGQWAPQERQTLRLLRGRWQQWLKRGRQPRREDGAVELADAPELIRDLVFEIAEDFDQPPLDDNWPIKGFTKDDLLDAEDDLDKLSDEELDLVVGAIVHASRDFPSAIKALVTFSP